MNNFGPVAEICFSPYLKYNVVVLVTTTELKLPGGFGHVVTPSLPDCRNDRRQEGAHPGAPRCSTPTGIDSICSEQDIVSLAPLITRVLQTSGTEMPRAVPCLGQPWMYHELNA